MDEDGLEKSLGIVDAPASGGNATIGKFESKINPKRLS